MSPSRRLMPLAHIVRGSRVGALAVLHGALACGVLAPSAPAAPDEAVVQHGDPWHYRKGDSPPAADWQTVPDASLDGSWSTGPGGFGYGDGDDGTVLTDMPGGYMTVYARRTFVVSPAMDPDRHLRLTVDYDDGFIVYLDGQEVARSANVPGAPGTPYAHDGDALTGNHEASAGVGGQPPEVIDLGPLGSLLPAGAHVLAAHGLNGDLNSSDLSLIVDLDLVDAPPPPVDVTWTVGDSPVELGSTLAVTGGATLRIEAGVEVVLGAGVSIQAGEGSHIELAGTAAAPVLVRRAAGGADWGEISAEGTGSSLTVRGAEISGGRLRFLAGSTGLVEDSVIQDSGASAIVHAVEATVTMRRCRVGDYNETLFQKSVTLLEDCLFEGPRADAVDFDAASPGSIIRRCTFRNGPTGTNTDAIDIGPTGGIPSRDVLIEDCVMHHFSDKGVSIGDGPDDAEDIVVRNCLIHDVSRGVQVKHGSAVTVSGCTIADSGIALHGYEKPGATGGGRFLGCDNNILSGNTSAITLEPDSVMELEYTDTQGVDWPGSGNINADPLFRDPAGGDYRLLPESPCLGAGRAGADMGVRFPVGGLPDVPGGLQVVSFDGSVAALSWTDPDERETAFVVEQSADGESWSAAAVVPGGTTTASVPGLDGQPTWSFRVRGRNFIGDSFASVPATTTVPVADSDGDGMPDAFEDLVPGLDPGDPSDADSDLDGDGTSNLDEFRAGTDPLDRHSVFRIDALDEAGPGVVEVRFEARAGKSYTVQYSDTLEPGSWRKLADVAAEPETRPEHVLVDSPPASAAFRAYRIATPALP